mmetsp:Transcript_37154/g.93242  ORF Transcript_37154/g.93242 Transcript_37154/m.93242 type:complete len:293 (+) Transcript_37154:2770-3648(+)
MVLCTSLSPVASSPRLPPMASTSSMNRMHAFLERAIWNSSRTIRAPSPTYFWTSSDPMTQMKQASVRLATARAVRVLPVPGGPYSSTPFGGSIPKVTKRSGCSSGISTTSLSRSSCSLHPPMSLYVMSGFSSTVIMVTDGSILGGSGRWIWYFWRSTPTLMPSSMSVGATLSLKPDTYLAYCLMLMMYLASSVPGLMILVHLATCSGCSSCCICLSAARSHWLGWAKPVSDSRTPVSLLIFPTRSVSSLSMDLTLSAYGPSPYVLRMEMSASSRGLVSGSSGSSRGLLGIFS